MLLSYADRMREDGQSSFSARSEIVVPLRKDGTIAAVLDIDSREKDHFDDTDRHYLEQLGSLIY